MLKKILLFGVLYLLSLFLVFYLFPRPYSKTTSSLPKKILPFPTITPTPTLSWKKHQNERFGHEISYPPDFKIEEWDIDEAAGLKTLPDGYIYHQARFFGESRRLEILIWANKAKAGIPQFLSWYRHEDLDLKKIPKEANFSIDGISAFRFGYPLIHIFFPYQDKVYELVYQTTGQLSDSVYDQMTGSFKFIKEETGPASLIALAKKELSKKSGINESSVTLVKTEEKIWPDSSLGCPEPGMFYIQVLTPGYLIILEAGGKNFRYHTDLKERVTLCEK